MARIDRYVARPGFEHCQQTCQGLQTAPRDHRHPVVRTYAQPDQVMGQCVGTGVQLAIAQMLIARLSGQCVRLIKRLLFDT